MRTIQMTLDDNLVDSVDEIVKKCHSTRSAFTRQALREAFKRFKINELETMHRKGYEKEPVKQDEFNVWEKEIHHRDRRTISSI